MEYRVIFAVCTISQPREETLQKFVNQINQLLQEGWRAAGGITVDNGAFYQALVR